MVYEGKEKCQGCGKPGTESIRRSKDKLCDECSKYLQLGKVREVESGIKYAGVFQHFNAASRELNNALQAFLAAVHNPHSNVTQGYHCILKEWGDNGLRYIVDSRIVEPLQALMEVLRKRDYELRMQLEELPGQAEKAANAERNKIFNEGVKYGRNLLSQLNSGEISVNEFEKERSKY